MSNVFHHLGHANRLRYFADMFEEYDRLYGTFLQITAAAQAGPNAHWHELESRIGFLRVRIAALCEETQLVLIKQAEERRRQRLEEAHGVVDRMVALGSNRASRGKDGRIRAAPAAC